MPGCIPGVPGTIAGVPGEGGTAARLLAVMESSVMSDVTEFRGDLLDWIARCHA